MRRPSPFWILAWLAAAVAFAHAFTLRWSCDDAYISFRYAQHFVDGHGLVFNLDPAEAPVEGYTNFAWTMWLALGMALGCTGDRIELFSTLSGALLHAGTVLLLASCAHRGCAGRLWLPVAALGLAVHHHAASLAPAGLETALFVLLGTAMLRFSIERRGFRDTVLLGCLAALAAMTRPDGLLFGAAAGAMVAYDSWQLRRPWPLGCFAAPLLCCLLPYLLWRRAYYGHWVPNTFHAKSGGDPYLAQGASYLWEYLACYYALIPCALLLFVLPLRRGGRVGAVAPWSTSRPGVALLLFAVPYVAFVVWVGGDFMFARFLLPVTPFLLLAADLVLRSRRWLELPVAALLLLGLWYRVEPPWLGEYRNEHGFSDNRAITMAELAPGTGVTLADYARAAGNRLGELCSGLEVRIGIAGGHANLAYRSRVPVAVECAAGLTDAYIARLPLPGRSVVGHERNWQLYPRYLDEVRGLHFMFELSYGDGSVVDRWRDIGFPVPGSVPLPARLVTWDPALMTELRRREPALVVADFERELDEYLATIQSRPRAEVERDYAALRRFVFDRHDDPVRRAAFERVLQR